MIEITQTMIDRAIAQGRSIERARRVLTREEGKLLMSCGPAPGGAGATRRQIKSAFKLVRDALTTLQERDA